jgi:hypothetical protein
MATRFARLGIALGLVLAAAAGQAACGGSKGTVSIATGAGGVGGKPGAGGVGGSGGALFTGSSGTQGSGGMASQGFVVDPTAAQIITVNIGASTPTVKYTATFNGLPANADWSVDQGALGTINAAPSSTATFAPSGAAGGVVNVLAGYEKATLKRPITIKLTGKQNGPTMSPAEQVQIPASVAQLSAGGGVGGVGGEGLGPAVTDMPTLTALGSPANNGQAMGLTFLYPYNSTVWPRGMLAPLLQWSWMPGDADAVLIKLSTTTGSFTWSGTFGRPAILTQTGGHFIRMPIPQDIWTMATNTAGGTDKLTVALTVAKGGVGYGPITETWTVAPALLTGTVYYNSYGTHFVKNWVSLDGAGNPVGAAILGVRSGATAPTLIAGQDSPLDGNGHPTDDTGCRVCHVVASKGRWLLTQSEQGNPGDGLTYLYDLSQANVPASGVGLTQQGTFGWAALTGDGSYALTNEVDPSSTNPAIGTTTSTFWNFIPVQPPMMMSPTTMPAAGTLAGLPAGVSAGYPSYAPDDKRVAYMDATGSTGNVEGPIDVAAYDSMTQTFSGEQTVVPAPAAGQRIGYPVFFPDDSALVFETEVRASQSDSVMVTRNGARSELWWVTLGNAPKAVALAALNGKNAAGMSYLPIGANNHGIPGASDPQSSYDETGWDDTTLDYEPTVLPIVEGGYAWVVFTSRRMYGSVLTAVPWESWPPDYDTTSLAQATVKKLWVAAIDLNAPAGSDPSHPAFYLPAQEILAGNSRGFWVLDPCKPDGQGCQTGDQCCNGYCEPNGDGGALICSNTPPSGNCSAPQEKCTTAANCCDTTNVCIDGFCAQEANN